MLRRSVALLLMMLAIPMISVSAPDDELTKLTEKRDMLKAEIAVLNNDKACVGDGECEALEMGAHACGGASQVVIYSTTSRNATLIKNKAKEFTALEKTLNLKGTNIITDCSSVNVPEVKCIKSACSAK